jgi:nanoRNase/pAp phosphatase (c-di-AMP/oligoRNAs hydrolase)
MSPYYACGIMESIADKMPYSKDELTDTEIKNTIWPYTVDEVQRAFELFMNRLHLERQADTLNNIADDINKLKKVAGNRVYVAINDVFDVIDKYRGVDE